MTGELKMQFSIFKALALGTTILQWYIKASEDGKITKQEIAEITLKTINQLEL